MLETIQADRRNNLEDEDARKKLLLTDVQHRLKRSNWRSKATSAMATLGLLHASTQPNTYKPPWNLPTPIAACFTTVKKSGSQEHQKNSDLNMINELCPVDFQLFADGSTLEGITNAGARLAVMRGNDCLHRWSGPMGCWSSSFQAVKFAMQQAFANRLEEVTAWSTALVLCDYKSLVGASKIPEPWGDVGIRTIQSAAKDLRQKDTSVLVSWIPGHFNVRGNDLADAEAKASSLAEQSPTAPDADTCCRVFDVVTNCSPIR